MNKGKNKKREEGKKKKKSTQTTTSPWLLEQGIEYPQAHRVVSFLIVSGDAHDSLMDPVLTDLHVYNILGDT